MSNINVLAWIAAILWECHARKRSYKAIDARIRKAMVEEAGAAA